jgi:hypothetical protein
LLPNFVSTISAAYIARCPGSAQKLHRDQAAVRVLEWWTFRELLEFERHTHSFANLRFSTLTVLPVLLGSHASFVNLLVQVWMLLL